MAIGGIISNKATQNHLHCECNYEKEQNEKEKKIYSKFCLPTPHTNLFVIFCLSNDFEKTS